MPREAPTVPLQLLDHVLRNDVTAPDKLRLIAQMRSESPEISAQVDRVLLARIARLQGGLADAQATLAKLRELHEQLTAPPWHAATLVAAVGPPVQRRFEIRLGDGRHVIVAHEDLDLETLRAGDAVYLNDTRNVIMARSEAPAAGDTALFDRWLPDGRLVLKARDEEIVVLAAAGLAESALAAGNLVRWDRAAMMALEAVPPATGERFFLEESPVETFADLGGLDRLVHELLDYLGLRMESPAIVKRYGLRSALALLLSGPPGNGKTLLARCLASHLGQLTGAGRSRFINVKPAALHSVWYSQSEQNYRELFRVAREASAREPGVPVVIFLDEIDAVAAVRGASLGRVDDRVQMALAAELDGFEARGNVMIIAATNRADAVDPALLRPGRLGDWIVHVPRPGRRAAADIFTKHLKLELPYAGNGRPVDAAAARAAIIEAVLVQIYAPNGAGALAVLRLADGSRRTVTPRDLVSGAVIARIAESARNRAALREARTGESGLRPDDVLAASEEAFTAAARVLTRTNCERYLDDLPEDVAVVAVEFPPRPAAAAHRYVSAA